MNAGKVLTGFYAVAITLGACFLLWLVLAIGFGHSVSRTGRVAAAMITPAWSVSTLISDGQGRPSTRTEYHPEEYHFVVIPDPVGDGDTDLTPQDKLVTRAAYFTHQVGSTYRWDDWVLNWKFWKRDE